MTLVKTVSYEHPHPHITDDGKVKPEGLAFALGEFRRKYQDDKSEAADFFYRLELEARSHIREKCKFKILVLSGDPRYSRFII